MDDRTDARRPDAEITGLLTRLAQRPTPAVVWYGSDGGRVELSGRVSENWIAKTANLLVDDLGLMPGDRVVLDPALHWRTLVLAAAAWRTGACVVLEPTDGDVRLSALLDRTGAAADALPSPEGSAAAAVAEAEDRLILAYPALAMRLPDDSVLEPGGIDYCAEIRSHGDRWSGTARPADADAALKTSDGALSFAELRDQAEARAAELGSAPVVHVAVDGWDRDALVGLLAIWAAEGTAVLSDRPRDEALQRDLAAERVGLTWS